MTLSTVRSQFPFGWQALFVFCAVCVVTSGCGYQVYEQRLSESAKYFAYVQRVDSSVAAPWKNLPTNPGPVEQLRVPLQFKEIRKPAPTKDPESGRLIEPEVDPRQPDYVALKLPGLVGTWEAPLRIAHEGATQTRKGYLYVLTNAYMFQQAEESRRAPDFVRDLLVVIAERLSLTPLDVVKDSQRETYPRSQPYYVPPKTYDVYRYTDAFRIDGVPYSIELYVQHSGPIDAVVMLALPVGIETAERMSERLPYVLETLKISSRPPAAPTAGPAGRPGAPAGAPAPAVGL